MPETRMPTSAVRRILLSTPVLLLLLCLWGVLLAWGVGLYLLEKRPDLVRNHIESFLAEHAPQLHLSMGAMQPTLWPAPGVRVEDVLLRAADGSTLFAEACELNFKWSALLSGNLVPGRVFLDAPVLVGPPHVSPPPHAGSAPADAPESPALPVLAALAGLDGMKIELRNAAVRWQTGPFAGSHVTGLIGVVTAPSGQAAGLLGLEPGAMQLTWQELVVLNHGPRLAIGNASLKVDDLRLSPTAPGFVRTGSVDFSGDLDIGTVLQKTRTGFKAALALTAGPPDVRGELSLSGNMLLNGVSVPVNGRLPFASRDVRQGVDFRDATLTMDTNSLTLTASFIPGDSALVGAVNVARFSLPRWFAFGRKLPSGLVNALDDLNGRLTFRLTPQNLEVPELRVNIRGIPFEGHADVANFAAPVIRVVGKTESADINKVFPELKGQTVADPSFNGPVVLGETPIGDGQTPDVGFDIRLTSREATFWKISGREFLLQLSPVWDQSRINVTGARITAAMNQLYDGNLAASAVVGDSINVNVDMADVNGEKLSHAVAGKAVFGGTLRARAALRGQGKTLPALLSGLGGSLNATLTGGFFLGQDGKIPFEKCVLRADDIAGTAEATTALPAQLPYKGRWRVDFSPARDKTAKKDVPPLRFSADSTGILHFSTENWLPLSTKDLTVRASGLAQGLPFNLSGRLTASLPEARAQLAGLEGRVAEAQVDATLEGRDIFAAPVWKGSLAAATSDLRGFLSRFELTFPRMPETALRSADLHADVERSDKLLRLSGIKGRVDATDLSGSLTRTAGSVPLWNVDMAATELDADAYRSPRDKSGKGNKNSKTDSPWPLQAMRSVNVKGEVRVARLYLWDFILQQCRFPLTLENGTLRVAPITLTVGGSPQQATFLAEPVDEALRLTLTSVTRNANMATLRRSVSGAESLGGQGFGRLDLSGLCSSSASVPACLSGTWSGNIQNGFFGTGRERRTFTSLSASGDMNSGVLNSKDFLLSGTNFSARGGGKVDLVNGTLDYRLNASMPGVPNIPVRYSGPIDDPKRNINAFSTLASVLSNVGSNVFGLFDSIITTPLKQLLN